MRAIITKELAPGEWLAHREGDNPDDQHLAKRLNPPPFGQGATEKEAVDDLLTAEYARSA